MYVLGVACAIMAGLGFNISLLVQKQAVARAAPGQQRMRALVRNRLWVLGIAGQAIFGTPFYVLAAGRAAAPGKSPNQDA